jgi:hypothetical protein
MINGQTLITLAIKFLHNEEPNKKEAEVISNLLNLKKEVPNLRNLL